MSRATYPMPDCRIEQIRAVIAKATRYSAQDRHINAADFAKELVEATSAKR